MNDSQSPDFTTTNWSLVVGAADATPERALEAMSSLCKRYWYPVYGAIRRQGTRDEHQAKDLAQEYFLFVIEHQVFQRARQERGKFRSFILKTLKNFLHNNHDRASAIKRGGALRFVPLDESRAEEFLASEPAMPADPGESFDRRWAVTLTRRVIESLRKQYADHGRASIFAALHPFLDRLPAPGDYARVGAQLGMETGTVAVNVNRLRKEWGKCLRAEVAKTVPTPDEVEDEVRYLLSILVRG